VRALAAVAVVALLAAPFYIWGSSRYFLGFDGDEVVVYRGLPYAPLGIDLNEEYRRTGLVEREIPQTYRDSVESGRLYTHEEADRVVRDLGDELRRDDRDAEGRNTSERQQQQSR
jgi:protein phosphatase